MALYHALREDTVVVDGLVVRYYDSEVGDESPPVVLLHGTGGPAENNFWAIFPMLAFTRRVIALDFALPESGVTLEQYVDQVTAVIERVSPGRPVALVGYSLGAVVASATAGRNPELVECLVLVAGWMKTDRQQRLRNEVWRTLNSEESAALGNFFTFTYYSGHHLLERTPAEYEAILAKAANVRFSPQVMELNRTIDISADVDRIQAPTLVIGCTLDQMVPVKHSRELFGGIENARYAEILSGHAVVHERPAELFVHIDRFVGHPEALPAGSAIGSWNA